PVSPPVRIAPSMKRFAFSPSISRILLALARTLVPPPSGDFDAAEQEGILRDCTRVVFGMPPLYRWGFVRILRIFNFLPFAFGIGFRRFVSLDADRQLQYVDSWALSRREIFRETTKTFKGLIMVVCFSDKKI